MDKDHDGYISKSEFASINKYMSPKQVLFVGKYRILNTMCQVKRVMGRFDNDGDGKLDFEEFQKFIKKK